MGRWWGGVRAVALCSLEQPYSSHGTCQLCLPGGTNSSVLGSLPWKATGRTMRGMREQGQRLTPTPQLPITLRRLICFW